MLSQHVIGHIDFQCVDVAVQAPTKIAMYLAKTKKLKKKHYHA